MNMSNTNNSNQPDELNNTLRASSSDSATGRDYRDVIEAFWTGRETRLEEENTPSYTEPVNQWPELSEHTQSHAPSQRTPRTPRTPDSSVIIQASDTETISQEEEEEDEVNNSIDWDKATLYTRTSINSTVHLSGNDPVYLTWAYSRDDIMEYVKGMTKSLRCLSSNGHFTFIRWLGPIFRRVHRMMATVYETPRSSLQSVELESEFYVFDRDSFIDHPRLFFTPLDFYYFSSTYLTHPSDEVGERDPSSRLLSRMNMLHHSFTTGNSDLIGKEMSSVLPGSTDTVRTLLKEWTLTRYEANFE